MDIAVLAIDLGKSSPSVVGLDATGRVVTRRRLRRDNVAKLAAGGPACVVAMEACCGAHHLGRSLRDIGHEVRLMSAEYVRPYVEAHENLRGRSPVMSADMSDSARHERWSPNLDATSAVRLR
jgi:transposase